MEGEGRVRVRPKRENDGKEVCVDSTASTRQGRRTGVGGGGDTEREDEPDGVRGGKLERGSGAWLGRAWGHAGLPTAAGGELWKVLLTTS